MSIPSNKTQACQTKLGKKEESLDSVKKTLRRYLASLGLGKNSHPQKVPPSVSNIQAEVTTKTVNIFAHVYFSSELAR